MKSVTLQVLAMFGMNNLQIINYCLSNNKKQKCDLETKPLRSDKPSRSLPRPGKTLSNIAFNTRQNLRGVTNMACTVAQGGKHHLLKIYQAENTRQNSCSSIQTRPSLKKVSNAASQICCICGIGLGHFVELCCTINFMENIRICVQ